MCFYQMPEPNEDCDVGNKLHKPNGALELGYKFLEVPRQGGIFGNRGSHFSSSVVDDPKYRVPASYRGPLIAQDDVQLRRR